MPPRRYRDTDIWPDNWKEWSVSLFLVGVSVVSVFAVLSTGAFTALTTERTATVTTTGDASALLAFEVVNEDYARIEAGTLEIAIDGSFGPNRAATGEGVDLNAVTHIDDVFRVVNRGPRPVAVWITATGRHADTVDFYDGPVGTENATTIGSRPTARTVGVGQSMTVSVAIDTRGVQVGPGEELVDAITVHAVATKRPTARWPGRAAVPERRSLRPV